MIQFLNVLFSYINSNSYVSMHPVVGWMQVVLFIVALVMFVYRVARDVYNKASTNFDVESYRLDGSQAGVGFDYFYNGVWYTREYLVEILDKLKGVGFVDQLKGNAIPVGIVYMLGVIFLHSITVFGFFKTSLVTSGIIGLVIGVLYFILIIVSGGIGVGK